MELRHLRYFVVTAQLEHFGRAAARLSIVQPALSKQIRELEAEIGTPLFERLPRGVRLTAAGRAFLQDATALLGQVGLAAQRARDVGEGKIGRLRIGFVDTSIYHPTLPRIIHDFRRQYPAVLLDLVQQTSLQQSESLRTDSIDVGFVYHRPTGLPQLASHPLVIEKTMLAVPTTHRFARRRQVRLAGLRDENFVWIPRALSPPFYDRVLAACERHGFAPRIVQESTTDATGLSLVATGVGITFSVASTVHRKPPDVTLVHVADLDVSFCLEAVWRTDNLNPALAHFLSLVKRCGKSAARTEKRAGATKQ